MHADRTNRVVLLVLGLVMLVAGLAVTLTSFAAFTGSWATRLLTDNPVSTYAGEHGRWLWPVAGVAALVVLVLALRWLYVIITGTDRVREFVLRTGSQDRVRLAASAVGDAVGAEIEGYRGVRAARAWLVGSAEQPTLAVRVDTNVDTDFRTVLERIERDAVAHARQALDRPDLAVRLDLEAKSQPVSRVS
jgi:hypothetical protein